MKEEFKIFYGTNMIDFEKLWDNAIFSFDTNVLLNLYRYSESTKNDFIDIIKQLNDKVWLAHHAVLEYHFNRLSVIFEQKDTYKSVSNILKSTTEDFISDLQTKLKKHKKKHPKIDISTLIHNLEKQIENSRIEIESLENSHPDLHNDDEILELLSVLFNGKIGPSFSQKELDQIFQDGIERYKKNQPPGYKDKDKKGNFRFFKDTLIKDEYGDLIIWKQLIEKAKKEKRPVIFITDDYKEDWWQIIKGRTIGPRNELVNEFFLITEEFFYMYNSESFLKYAQEFLNSNVKEESIKEASNLRRSNNIPQWYTIDFFQFKYPYLNREDIAKIEQILEVGASRDDFVEAWADAMRFSTMKEKGYKLETQDEIGQLELDLDVEDENVPKYNTYSIGDKVVHAKWGYGIVTEVNYIKAPPSIKVMFNKSVGVKTLSANLTLLKRVNSND